MPQNLHSFLVEAVMDHASTQTPDVRAKLYRGLAGIIADQEISAEFVTLAQDIEQTERRCRQLKLKFLARS